jgi:hypothetical protein
MQDNQKNKICPEYCPFLKANATFCELFKRSLQTGAGAATMKCEECLNPEQRMESYKNLGLSLDGRVEMWKNAMLKHNEIELSKKRAEEEKRQQFSAFLDEKFGARPPLEGNVYLHNLLVNLFMVMDTTERNMLMNVLKGKNADSLIKAVDRAPKDENLLRNVRHELYEQYNEQEKIIQITRENQSNIRI